jgi:hypothetical protein
MGVAGVRATAHFDVVTALAIGPGAGDLNPLARHVVVDAGAVLRHVAGLSVHLHRALALIFERVHQVDFRLAAQHAHMPAPVEEH